MKPPIRIAIIGMGKMGEAIAQGLMQSTFGSQYKIVGTTKSEESATDVKARLKIECTTDNAPAIQDADLVFLAVKPHQVKEILELLLPFIRFKKIQAKTMMHAATLLMRVSRQKLSLASKRRLLKDLLLVQDHNYRSRHKKKKHGLMKILNLTP